MRASDPIQTGRDSVSNSRLRPGFDRRAAVALGLALAAVITATLAARGPAHVERASFSWPPAEVSASIATGGWYAPLLLARHNAERIDAHIPCGDRATVPDAGSSVLVFSTARDPLYHYGLAVTRQRGGRSTIVHVGRETIATIVTASGATDCAFDVTFDGRDWSVTRPGAAALTGTLDHPPAVSGLFTELDLRTDPGLRVDVRPFVQDTRPTTTQTALRLLTVLLLLAVIAVLAQPTVRWGSFPRPGRPRLAAQDLVVLIVIGVWWLLAPLHFDDGWVRARELNSLVSGGFSNYYEYEGANLPLATWFEWLQHYLVARTDALGLHRLPNVASLTAAWLVCRWCLTRLVGRPSRTDAAWWAAALAFCVGVVAFGMTLRAEPAIVLLVVGVLACCLRYLETPRLGALLIAVLLCGLAVTAHPAGVIAVAPLLLCIPRMWQDARNRAPITPIGLVAVLPFGLAWALLLAFLDSDVERRNDNVAIITASGNAHSNGVLREYERYQFLNDWGASPVRREFVALLFLAVAALAVERLSRRRTLVELLPTASIALGLLLLAVTPSKWLWHFGGFVGLAAVAIGYETHRLAARGAGRRAGLVVATVVGLTTLAASIDPRRWGPLDVGRPDGHQLTLLLGGATLGALALVFGLASRGRLARPDLLVLPAVSAGVIGVSVLTLAASAAAESGWSVPRQVASSLAGTARSCGVADDLAVPTPDSIRALPVVTRRGGTRNELAAGRSGILNLAPATDEWYRLQPGPMGVFVSGSWGPVGRLNVEWGHTTPWGVDRLRSRSMTLPKAPGRTRRRDWTLVPGSSFPTRPPLADAVRVLPRRTATGVPFVTQPVSFDRASVGSLLRSGQARPGMDPMVFEATPCASLPTLAYGLAEPANLLVEWLWGPSFDNRTSPFLGLDNLFSTFDVPVTKHGRPETSILAFWVLPDPREGLAPPTRRVWLE